MGHLLKTHPLQRNLNQNEFLERKVRDLGLGLRAGK